MRSFSPVLFALLFFVLPAKAQVELQNAFPSLSFNRPVDLQHAGDESNRLFVVEQSGRILVFENRSDVQSYTVFLDIRDRVKDDGNEEGLLGLAFHPFYKTNGYFYVNYTARNPSRTVISRFQRSATDANSTDITSEAVLLEFAQPYSNHNGGQLAFGPDGYMYISTGDGGSGGDPQNNSQNRASMLGKILRIDVDKPAAPNSYGIPDDNPYKDNDAGFREEIWAYGLRNPWRFSFDASSKRLWVADVGQDRYEEIDIIVKGGNYGWKIMEGFSCYNPATNCDTTGLILPVFVYEHTLGSSVTGGHVYEGKNAPSLLGQYLFADFISGRIWGLDYQNPEKVISTELLRSNQNISSFGKDQFNETYICTFSGSLFKFKSTVNTILTGRQPATAGIDKLYPSPVARSSSKTVLVEISIPEANTLRLSLHDTLGRTVMTIAEGHYSSGLHSFRFEVKALRAGIHFVNLQLPDSKIVRKLLIFD